MRCSGPQNEGGNLAFHTELGEDDGLAEAAHVAEVRMESQRLAAVPMEPNGILVEPGTPDGGMTVIFPSQAPIGLKDGFAGLFGLDGDNVRLIAPRWAAVSEPRPACIPSIWWRPRPHWSWAAQ